MRIEPPIILDESIKVVEWARTYNRNIPLVFSLLFSDKIDKHRKDDEALKEARRIFQEYSPSRDRVMLAIQLDAYRRETDFKEGQIVTNDDLVGYATNLDFTGRTFDLYNRKETSSINYIGTFEMDDFKAV